MMSSNVAQPESGVTILKKLLTTGNNVSGKTLFMSLSSRPIVKVNGKRHKLNVKLRGQENHQYQPLSYCS